MQHIKTIYTITVLDTETDEETIYAQDTNSIYGGDGPSMMQAVTTKLHVAQHIIEFARKEFPYKTFKLV